MDQSRITRRLCSPVDPSFFLGCWRRARRCGRRAALAGSLAATLSLTGVHPAAGATWANQDVAAPLVPAAFLSAVSCPSPTSCVAVGERTGGGGVRMPFAERWNGRRWTALGTSNPRGATAARLDAVSCPSVSVCLATGWFIDAAGRDHALAEGWNGRNRVIEPLPRGVASLSGVSCASPNACTAVGGSGAVRRIGTRWVRQVSPRRVRLTAVSCWAARDCVAVGSAGDAVGAERWDGHRWMAQPVPDPCSEDSDCASYLSAVSCISATMCLAVGSVSAGEGPPRTVVVRWEGRRWLPEANPDPGEATDLYSVSCVTAGSCTAVGDYGSAQGSERPLVEHWSNRRWTIELPARPDDATNGSFSAVSCQARTTCIGVGVFSSGVGLSRLLAEGRRTAGWVVQPIDVVSGPSNAALNGVSCPSGTGCTAVGSYINASGIEVTWAVHATGSAWRRETTPNPPAATSTVLNAVSCSSSIACWAVGWTVVDDTGRKHSVLERRTGSRWTMVSVPLPRGTKHDELLGISCSSADLCIAVGDYGGTESDTNALAEIWDGSTWKTRDPQFAKSVNQSQLSDVSCAPGGGCTAVGSRPVHYDHEALAERWANDEWTIQPIPKAATPDGTILVPALTVVSCPSAIMCLAVGSDSEERPTIEAWDGVRWRKVDYNLPRGADAVSLDGIACAGADACVAVGRETVRFDRFGNTADKALVESWDGKRWSRETLAPAFAARSSQLKRVWCGLATSCTAVGTFATAARNAQPLVNRGPSARAALMKTGRR